MTFTSLSRCRAKLSSQNNACIALGPLAPNGFDADGAADDPPEKNLGMAATEGCCFSAACICAAATWCKNSMSSISLSFLSCSVSRYADIFLTDGDDCWTTARLDDTSPLILFEKYWKLDD